jgi:hypothetical protein
MLNDFFANCEAHARTRFLSPVQAFEKAEYALRILRIDSDAVIGH